MHCGEIIAHLPEVTEYFTLFTVVEITGFPREPTAPTPLALQLLMRPRNICSLQTHGFWRALSRTAFSACVDIMLAVCKHVSSVLAHV